MQVPGSEDVEIVLIGWFHIFKIVIYLKQAKLLILKYDVLPKNLQCIIDFEQPMKSTIFDALLFYMPVS